MPRNNRHRSHRGHKHGSRERSESEEEREARDLKEERRKGSPAAGDADFAPAERGKKRKERFLDTAEGGDRWNGEGRAGAEEKEPKGEEFGAVEEERSVKSKSLGGETRSRSSRRHENLGSERKEEGSGRDELKRRSDKDLNRRDGQYGDGKDAEREHRSSRDDRDRAADRESVHGSGRERERATEKDKEYGIERERDYAPERSKEYDKKRDRERRAESERDRHSTRDRSSDGRREKPSYSSTMGNYEEEYVVKGVLETAEHPRLDDSYDRGTEKDLKKEIKRDDLNEDKWHSDSRKGDDRRVAAMDERLKISGHHDEKYRGSGSREKLHDELDRDRRSRSDKSRGDRSLRDHANDRSESKYYKDSDKHMDNRNKNKIQDNDSEATPFFKDHGMKRADCRGTKRSPDDIIEDVDMKPRNAKEARSSVDKRISDNYKPESIDDRGRPESIHSNRVELTPSRDHKNSPVSTVHSAKEEIGFKQTEPIRGSLSKDGHRTSSASSGDPVSVSGAAERMVESQSVESNNKYKDFAHSVDCVIDDVPPTVQCERTPRSDGPASAFPSSDKSPPSGERSNVNRKGARRSLDIDEAGQRSGYVREGRDHSIKEEKSRDFSQGQFPNSEAGRSSSLSHGRADHIARSSPGHLPPPPPVRHGMDSPSVLRSGEDDGRGQAGDRKPNNHYKRGGDLNLGRGQGGGWNGVHPSWQQPVANGFIPFQHGPSAGFLPVPQQFPPPIFGVRPFMDFNHAGVPLHMHDPPDRFSGHNRPFGWRNPSDEPGPPHIQGWEGNNGMFGNESHMYGRPEWDQSRHLISDRGWEMNGSHWKSQSGNSNMGKETESSTHPSVDDARSGQVLSVNEQNLVENTESKQPIDSPRKSTSTPDSTRKIKAESPEPLNSKDNGSNFSITYLSKLDISHDLACPNLYKQCTNIVESEEHGVFNMGNKHVRDQNSHEGVKLITRTLKFSVKPMFSAITDAVFKKAMSLYQKTAGESTIKKAETAVGETEEPDNVPETPDIEVESMENALPGGAPDTDCLMEEDSLKTAEDGDESVENNDSKAADAEEAEATDVAKGDEGDPVLVVSNLSCGDVGMDVDSSKISSSEGVEADSAGDKRCEELMPECLSRIPNSPKSTH